MVWASQFSLETKVSRIWRRVATCRSMTYTANTHVQALRTPAAYR
jgi:hypothetical protein